MSVIMSLFLGLVQGITEFLPISSSGHLSILQNLFALNHAEDEHLLFTVFLHLGTLISIIAVYRKEIKSMISDGLLFLRMRSDTDMDEPIVMKPPARALLFVLIGTIPMLITLIFIGSISRLFLRVGFIGFALIITGGLLYVSDKHIQRGNKTEKTMTITDALLVGLSQAAAVIPGLSRTGTTVAVGLACGFSGSFAVRFSLLLSIPAVFGATVVTLYTAIREGINFSLFFVYFAGFVISVITGFFAIQLFRRLVSKGGFGKLAYYCWGVGALTMVMSLMM